MNSLLNWAEGPWKFLHGARRIVCCALCAVLLVACSRESDYVSLGLEAAYYIPRMSKLRLQPSYSGSAYRWLLQTAAGNDSLLSAERELIFLSAEEGTHALRLEIDTEGTTFTHSMDIHVTHENVEYSPFTSRVLEYMPAPGQHTNTLPLYEEGDDAEDMRRKAEDCLVADEMITLGAFGGYVVFGFDHTIVNVPGKKDLYIRGNANYAPDAKDPTRLGGSAEPGIVEVAFDRNLNGRPDDDEWYELAGSAYRHPATVHGYSITYHRPTEHTPIPDRKNMQTDTVYIAWEDNQGQTGYIPKNSYHSQDYFPAWIERESLSFSGTRLPGNSVDESGIGRNFILYAFDWGYVDNHPNEQVDLCSFDLSWAVDRQGNPVSLPGADFIRVYTSLNQKNGWIGDTSTEVARATDLHLSR
jgi:hypothetical protein